jgi:hypothetical protein
MIEDLDRPRQTGENEDDSCPCVCRGKETATADKTGEKLSLSVEAALYYDIHG